ncbi:hypothetical protein KC799_27770, partial [candidate division KSB1 bacterium]|nr:hypothetical protein [candidate division KSB1 bacterium]
PVFDFGFFMKLFVASKILSFFITFLVAWALLKKQEKATEWSESVVDFLKFALPTIPIVAIGWLISGVDRIFIINHYSYHVLGFYSGIQTYLSKILLLLLVFTIVYPKIQTKWLDEQKIDLLTGSFKLYAQVKDIIFWIAFILLLGFHQPFFNSFIGLEADPSQQSLVMILLVGHFLYASLVQMNFVFYLSKKSNYILYATSVAAGVNLLINFLFINKSIFVPAIATVIAYAMAIGISYLKTRSFVRQTHLTGHLNINQLLFPMIACAFLVFEKIPTILFVVAAVLLLGFQLIRTFNETKPAYLQIYNSLRSY